jgi:hypothetical protein
VKSRKVYDQQVLIVLRQIWIILDYICGKRLVAIMPEVIRRLEYFGELKIESESETVAHQRGDDRPTPAC